MAEASIGRSAWLRDEIVRVTDLAIQAPAEKELMSKQANSLKSQRGREADADEDHDSGSKEPEAG
jgi:hypothetical protein